MAWASTYMANDAADRKSALRSDHALLGSRLRWSSEVKI